MEKFKPVKPPGLPAYRKPETITVGGLVYTSKPLTTRCPRLPRGTLEIWFNETAGWVYLGIPRPPQDEHNCDAMGCGSSGLHVLMRVAP